MRFHWIRVWVQQDQFQVIWKPGEENLADYFTKHHNLAHHQKMRPLYLLNYSMEDIHGEGVLIYDPDTQEGRYLQS